MATTTHVKILLEPHDYKWLRAATCRVCWKTCIYIWCRCYAWLPHAHQEIPEAFMLERFWTKISSSLMRWLLFVAHALLAHHYVRTGTFVCSVWTSSWCNTLRWPMVRSHESKAGISKCKTCCKCFKEWANRALKHQETAFQSCLNCFIYSRRFPNFHDK